jgi:hypothetical protein
MALSRRGGLLRLKDGFEGSQGEGDWARMAKSWPWLGVG